MNWKDLAIGGVIGGIGGVGLGYVLHMAQPQSDIDEYAKRLNLANVTEAGTVITLVSKPVYVFNMPNWRYGCTYLYMTPQGDVNAIIDVSKYSDHYEAEIARMCADRLDVYVDGQLKKTFPSGSEIGYYTHRF